MNPFFRRAPRWFSLTLLLLGLGLLLPFPGWSEQQPTTQPKEVTKAAPAPADSTLPDAWVKSMTWRCIGPANMGGRITAIAVYEADPSTYYVATASGGLLKTTNNGITFRHQFDKEATVSIGDVCVAQSNRDIVWIGTGENNPRNSVSWGDGVYKSTDGGENWTNMGLKKSFQIGRIAIHPKNPDIVYVGAMGRLYGPHPERGLFKTTDGGKTWEKILFIDDNTGVIDVQMHPTDPDTLLVATWELRRDGFDSWPGGGWAEGYDGYDPIKKWGPGSGLYKTTNGGKTFKRLSSGLPTCPLGRMNVDYYRKDPNVIFAIIDCEKIGMGTPPKTVAAAPPYVGLQGEDAGNDKGARLTELVQEGPAEKAGLKVGDVIRQLDDKTIKTYDDLMTDIGDRKPGDKIKVKLVRDNEEKGLELIVGQRPTQPGSAYLGIQGQDAGEGKGARLTTITQGGPAEKAGLKTGDVVSKMGDKPIKTYQELLQISRAAKPGDKVKLQVVRGGETKDFELTYGQRGGPGGAFGPGGPTPTRPYRAFYGGQAANVTTQGPNSHEYGGVYKSTDGGESWTRINSLNPRPMYFSQVRVDPTDENHVYVLGINLHRSRDGGKNFSADQRRQIHADGHAMWINPRDGRHLLIGTDGGHYVSYDRTANWDHFNHMSLGQFYHVAVCTKKPYWVYGGLQDNGCWGGPSVGLSGTGPLNEDWLSINSGDGYVCRVDPNDPDQIYAESQDGGMMRLHLKTGERKSLRPTPPEGSPPYRFNWNTPYILSSHNSRIYYCGGNYVFRSLHKGDDLRIISPEITATKRGSATALAESPKNPEVLWAGTDDGWLWVTRNGGKDWTNVAKKVGLPGPRWVATIEASREVEGRAYVVFDAHRSDDDEPYVYVTEDFGETWKSLRNNLPTGSTRCLREDVENPNLLYLGTEFAIYASLNRGDSWTKLNNNLPTVAVHEIAVHPTAGEIVAGTHGRSLWILDVTALRQMKPEALKEAAHLYKPNTTIRWQRQPSRGGTNRRFAGTNPLPGAHIYYSLTQPAEKVSLRVLDIDGEVVSRLQGSAGPGLHKVTWDLTRPSPHPPDAPPPRFGGGRGQQIRQFVAPGAYRVVLTVDGKEVSQSFRVEGDPNVPPGLRAEEEEIEVGPIDD